MFIDKVELNIASGHGGPGVVSFRKEKFVTKGGPDGGDGGDGGSVYIRVDRNTDTLSNFKGRHKISSNNGYTGDGKRMHGKRGESEVLVVPPGTQVINASTGDIIVDMQDGSDDYLLLKGGKGGLGNYHFKNSRNQAPTYAQPGLPGEELDIVLELKLIANVGLVGFPNVGKSTLISKISNATPQVANYEFTTLTPKLGVVNVGDYNSFVMADIPGIIEGASDGKGLGLEFLRHIERTNTLLFLIDLSNYRESYDQYQKLKTEIKTYSEELSSRPFAIVLTKTDALDEISIKESIDDFFDKIGIIANNSSEFSVNQDYSRYIQEVDLEGKLNYDLPYFILPISSVSQTNLNTLKFALYNFINQSKDNEES